MKPKNLAEFIEDTIDDVAIGMYCDETHNLSDELERNEHEIAEAKDIMKRFAPRLVSHLLEVAKEKSYDIHEDYYSDTDTPLMVVDLKDLTTYCAPVEDLKK